MCLALNHSKEPQPTKNHKTIYIVKMQLIRAKINKLNYDIRCHVQSMPVKRLINAKVLIRVGLCENDDQDQLSF